MKYIEFNSVNLMSFFCHNENILYEKLWELSSSALEKLPPSPKNKKILTSTRISICGYYTWWIWSNELLVAVTTNILTVIDCFKSSFHITLFPPHRCYKKQTEWTCKKQTKKTTVVWWKYSFFLENTCGCGCSSVWSIFIRQCEIMCATLHGDEMVIF